MYQDVFYIKKVKTLSSLAKIVPFLFIITDQHSLSAEMISTKNNNLVCRFFFHHLGEI